MRYHLWLRRPRSLRLSECSHTLRNNGRTRHTPTAHMKGVQRVAPGCISPNALAPFHQPEALFAVRLRVLLPIKAL